MNPFLFAATFMLLLILSIYWHELGHAHKFRKYGINASIKFYFTNWRRFGLHTGSEADYNKLNPRQRVAVGLFGVVSGLIPIILISSLINTAYFLVLVPYIMGCLHDIELIIKNKKNGFF